MCSNPNAFICYGISYYLKSVQSSSVTQSCPTLQPHESHTAQQASLSITNSRSLLKPMSIELVMPSSHLIFCRPLLLLLPITPSIRVFSNESTLRMRWTKYWSFSFNISPSSEHPRTYLLQDGLVGSPCSSRDSQESSPIPQFKSINFSMLNFLYNPTPTSIHDHQKNHSLDQVDFCWQSNVSAFNNMAGKEQRKTLEKRTLGRREGPFGQTSFVLKLSQQFSMLHQNVLLM